jgi:hypothetical protein
LIVEHRQLEMWILIQEAVGAIEGAWGEVQLMIVLKEPHLFVVGTRTGGRMTSQGAK